MNIRIRAAIRTVAMLCLVAIITGLIYAFAVLGMLPGVIILISIIAVFTVYDINKSQIEYEDRLEEISKKYSK